MMIDWFTVAAQALNFVILVWLMKRFLYKPILHAIDSRERRIATELADADAAKAEARKERDEFQRRNEEYGQARQALFDRAKDEASAERQRLLDEARRDSETLRAKRRDAFERDQQSLKKELTRRTQQEVFAIARKTLADLAATDVEERMSAVFMRRLHELDMETKDRIARALTASSDPVRVRSAFDMPVEQQSAIRHALKESLPVRIEVEFETAPELISGIEIVANGHKVAWSIADYLASLERSVDELLQEKSGSGIKPDIQNKQAE